MIWLTRFYVLPGYGFIIGFKVYFGVKSLYIGFSPPKGHCFFERYNPVIVRIDFFMIKKKTTATKSEFASAWNLMFHIVPLEILLSCYVFLSVIDADTVLRRLRLTSML